MYSVTLCTGGLDPRDLKTALPCISFLRKGEVLAYVGRIHNLKDLKDLSRTSRKVLCTLQGVPRSKETAPPLGPYGGPKGGGGL